MKRAIFTVLIVFISNIIIAQIGVVEKGAIWRTEDANNKMLENQRFVKNFELLKEQLKNFKVLLENNAEMVADVKKNLELADSTYRKVKKIMETIPEADFKLLNKYTEQFTGISLNPKDYISNLYKNTFVGDLMEEYNIEPIDFEVFNITDPKDLEIYATEFADEISNAIVKKYKKTNAYILTKWNQNLRDFGKGIKKIEAYCTKVLKEKRRELDTKSQTLLFNLHQNKNVLKENVSDLVSIKEGVSELFSFYEKQKKAMEIKDKMLKMGDKLLSIDNENIIKSSDIHKDFMKCVNSNYLRELKQGIKESDIMQKTKDNFSHEDLVNYLKDKKEKFWKHKK